MSNEETNVTEPRALSASDLLQDVDTPPLIATAVQTPEFGVGTHVFVADLEADERDELESWWAEKKEEEGSEDNIGFRGWVAAFCLCDKDKKRFYVTTNDIVLAAKKLGTKSAKVIARIFNQACHRNGLLKSDIDELEKKFEKTPTASGNGESPSVSASQVAKPGSAKSRRSSTPSS